MITGPGSVAHVENRNDVCDACFTEICAGLGDGSGFSGRCTKAVGFTVVVRGRYSPRVVAPIPNQESSNCCISVGVTRSSYSGVVGRSIGIKDGSATAAATTMTSPPARNRRNWLAPGG